LVSLVAGDAVTRSNKMQHRGYGERVGTPIVPTWTTVGNKVAGHSVPGNLPARGLLLIFT
jgi:hypothetical protein